MESNDEALPNIRQRQEAIRDILFRGGKVLFDEYDPLRDLYREASSNKAVKVWKTPTRNEPWQRPLTYNHKFLFECVEEFRGICARILKGLKAVESDPFIKLRNYFGQFVGDSDVTKEWKEEKEILDQSDLPFLAVIDHDSWTHEVEGLYPLGCISGKDRQKVQEVLSKGIREGHNSIVIRIGNTECHIELVKPSLPILTPVHRKEPANRRYINFNLFTNIRGHIAEDSVDIVDRLAFYKDAANLYTTLKKTGLPVCFPEVTDTEIVVIQDFYPLYHDYPKKQYTMNSLRLDKEKPIAVITGLNDAGKSTVLDTVDCIGKMARASLPVPASSCIIGNFNNIQHQEIIGGDMGRGLGTFRNQSRCLKSTLEELLRGSGNSIGLFDESLSGTDHVTGKAAICEALKILAQVIKRPTILVTHCTPAARDVEENPTDYPGVQLLCFRKTPQGEVSHKMQVGIGRSEGEYILEEEGLSLKNFQKKRKK